MKAVRAVTTVSLFLPAMLGRTALKCVSAFASSIPNNVPRSGTSAAVVGHASPHAFVDPQLRPSASTFSTTRTPLRNGGETTSALGVTSTSLSVAQEEAAKSATNICGTVVEAEFGGQRYWDTSASSSFRVFFVLGGPGAGKGTQSELLKQNYPCVHLSVGELLRNVPADSPHKALVDECLVEGKIVPVEISLNLLQAAMEKARSEMGESLLFLVDGFPRNFNNLEGWVRCMSDEEIASVWGTLMFTCPLQELERRILARAETSGRSDDNLQSAKKRFQTFEKETVPVVNTLRRVQKKLETSGEPSLKVVDIKGNQPMENVWEDTQNVMNQFVAHDVWTANSRLVDAILTSKIEVYEKLTEPSLHDTKETLHFTISNAKMEFLSGKKVNVSFDRSDGLRETRVWSYEGKRGWINIHFYRTQQTSS